jgi:hypothetical protein
MAALRSWRGLASNNDHRYRSQWRDRTGVSPASSTMFDLCNLCFCRAVVNFNRPNASDIEHANPHHLIRHGPTSATRAAAFPLDEPLGEHPTSPAGTPAILRRVDRCWRPGLVCTSKRCRPIIYSPFAIRERAGSSRRGVLYRLDRRDDEARGSDEAGKLTMAIGLYQAREQGG